MQRHQAAKRSRGGGYDDEDEPIVFYDLDAGSGRRNPLLCSPESPRRSANAKRANSQKSKSAAAQRAAASGGKRVAGSASGILQRPREIFHQQPLFQLDDDHESEDENPFASLLLQPPQRVPQPFGTYEDDNRADYVMQTASPPESQASTATFSRATNATIASSRKSSSPVRVTPPRHASSAAVSPDDSAASALLSLLRRERPQAKPSAALARPSAAPKRLSVEAANSRPSRWSQKSTVASTGQKAASRRKSVPNALQRKRQTGRTSLPLTIMESHREEDEDASQQSGLSKRRRLADVLMRATMLSQQKPQHDDERPSQQHSTSNDSFAMENDDAIADTELQMRQEKFETQFFSPSKLNNQSALARKKQQKPVASKIRGELGEAVARAIRKATRDLTMLHSHGQTLVEQNSGSALMGLDRVQDRGFTAIRLRRKRQSQRQQQGGSSGDLTMFDACIQRLSPDLQAPCDEGSCVRVAFSAQTATQLMLQPDALVKVYAPFHFIPLVQPVGSSSGLKRPKWLLVGTTLSEITSLS